MIAIYFFFSLILAFGLNFFIHGKLSTYEYSILHDLYNSSNGPYWNFNGSYPWNFSGYSVGIENDPCSEKWGGITCNSDCDAETDSCVVELLNLTSHNLSGFIPENIWDLNSSFAIILSRNELSGTIPKLVPQLNSLRTLDLDTNALYGSIPTSLSCFTLLEFLDLSSNFFTSTFPNLNLSSLVSFEVNDNLLTGPLAQNVLSYFNRLHSLNLQYNYFSGGLERVGIAHLSSMISLIVSYNKFSNTLPNSIGSLRTLSYLSLEYNYLSGSLASSYGNLTNLQYLYLQNNYLLSGSLPSSLSKWSSLRVLILCNNIFTGALDPIFDVGHQVNVENLDLSSNKFSGPVPSTVFNLPNLQSLVMGKNCFSGTLPSTICNATSLTTLKLNNLAGLYQNTVNYTSTAQYFETCNSNYLFNPSFDYYNTSTKKYNHFMLFNGIGPKLSGTLPSCLLDTAQLPLLTNLYLSGIGLSGPLPTVQISPNLVNLSLSYNHFTGNIPMTIQDRSPGPWFKYLDLSFNQFNGTITGFQTPANATIKLNNNRLSGWTPQSFNSLHSLNVLEGNVFAPIPGQGLPPKDPSRYPVDTYIQGSQQLDFSLAILVAIVLSFTVIVALEVWSIRGHTDVHSTAIAMDSDSASDRWSTFDPKEPGKQEQDKAESNSQTGLLSDVPSFLTEKWQQFIQYIRNNSALLFTWLTVADPDPTTFAALFAMPNTRLVPGAFELRFCVKLFKQIRFVVVLIGMPLILVGFILIPVLKVFYRTHTYQYGWAITLAYMAGLGPVVCILISLTAMMCTVVWYLVVRNNFMVDTMTINRENYIEYLRQRNKMQTRSSPGAWLKSFTIGVLFLSFDIAVLLAINIFYVFDVQNSSPLNETVAVQICLSLFKVLFNSLLVPLFLRQMLLENTSNFITFRVAIFYLNNVIIPCIATAVTDPSCFLTLFLGNDLFNSAATYPSCSSFDLTTGYCNDFATEETVIYFIPAFTYNDQCSSGLLSNYIPVTMYTYAMNLMIAAFGSVVVISINKKYIPEFLISVLPGLLWPEDVDEGLSELLRMDGILASVMSSFIILFTFGFACPPLAAAAVMLPLIQSYEWQILFGRYLTEYSRRRRESVSSIAQVRISTDYYGLWNGVKNSIWISIFGGALFYTFINIDFIGGPENYWVVIVTLIIPLLLFIGVTTTERSMTFFDVYNTVPRGHSDLSLVSSLRDSLLSQMAQESGGDNRGVSMRLSRISESSAQDASSAHF